MLKYEVLPWLTSDIAPLLMTVELPDKILVILGSSLAKPTRKRKGPREYLYQVQLEICSFP